MCNIYWSCFLNIEKKNGIILVNKQKHIDCKVTQFNIFYILSAFSRVFLGDQTGGREISYLGHEELVNHSALSVVNSDFMGRDREREVVVVTGSTGLRLELRRRFIAATFQ